MNYFVIMWICLFIITKNNYVVPSIYFVNFGVPCYFTFRYLLWKLIVISYCALLFILISREQDSEA